MDFVTPRRPVALRVVSGRGHYDEVVTAALAAHTSVWIATANVKELMIEDHRARPGVRRRLGKTGYRSVLAAFAELADRGVELRILHADRPSRPFRAELAQHPVLTGGDSRPLGAMSGRAAVGGGAAGGALAMRACPRVHLKLVIVDGALLYLGSANWTGAGLGVRGSGRRNFEVGMVTDDGPLLDQMQGLYERIWSGGECGGCGLRRLCPAPLDRAQAAPSAVARPRRSRKRKTTARKR